MSRLLTTINPLSELERMVATVDRALGSMWADARNGGPLPGTLLAPVDIYELDNVLHLVAQVPGVKPEDLDVSIDNAIITIRGSIRESTESAEGARVYRREMRSGEFVRSFQLPENLEFDQIDATFDNGIVTIRIPVKVEQKPEPKKVPVRSAADSTERAKK